MVSSCFKLRPCQSSWSGSGIGLSRYSLRFSNIASEDTFVNSRADQLKENLFVFLSVCIIVNAFQAVYLFFVLDASYDVELISFRRYETVAGLVFNCSCMLVFTREWVLSHMGHALREFIISTIFALGIFWVQCTGSDWYILKWYGRNPTAVHPNGKFSDAGPLITSAVLLTCLHTLLPIRWRMAFIAEVACALGYSVNVFVLGSSEPAGGSYLWMMNIVLVVLGAFGKRSLELNERLMFAKVTSEKCLRAQAEFQLSLRDDEASMKKFANTSQHYDCVDTAGAVALCETTSSGKQCRSELASSLAFKPGENGDLKKLVALGQKEQWLIPDHDLDFPCPSGCVLGQGSYGVVIPGVFFGKRVAVKVYKDPVGKLVEYLNEVRILRKLRHDNVVLFFGACVNVEYDEFVLVFELLDGLDFKTFIERRGPHLPLPFELSSCKALLDVCAALCYLHSRDPSIVHGDLKDTNIFVEDHGRWPRAKILDFGLSRLVKTGAPRLGGTLKWMAPELLRAGVDSDSAPLHVAADVFSLGRLIFLVATGEQPMQGVSAKTMRDLAHSLQTAPMDWPAVTTDVMSEYRSIANSCCAPAWLDRPAASLAGQCLREVFDLISERYASEISVSCRGSVNDFVAFSDDSPSESSLADWKAIKPIRETWEEVARSTLTNKAYPANIRPGTIDL